MLHLKIIYICHSLQWYYFLFIILFNHFWIWIKTVLFRFYNCNFLMILVSSNFSFAIFECLKGHPQDSDFLCVLLIFTSIFHVFLNLPYFMFYVLSFHKRILSKKIGSNSIPIRLSFFRQFISHPLSYPTYLLKCLSILGILTRPKRSNTC